VIAAPSFYAQGLGDGVDSHRQALAMLPRPVRLLVAKPGLARGLALGWLARRERLTLAVIRRERGSLPALAVCALPPARRRIFVLELIRRPLPASWWRRALYRIWLRALEGPALRRGMSAAQVMTGWEREEYADHYRLERARLHHVPWAWREGSGEEPAEIADSSRRVFSSGRTACDWETLFAAAAGAGWALEVACSRADADRVRPLAAAVGAELSVELPWAEHDRALRAAAVCVIALSDRGLSAGQVRLMSAVEAGVAVVATRVRSLQGYAVEGVTAELVEPGSPGPLRDRVEALLADPGRRRRLRDAARARAGGWTYAEYFAALRGLLADSPALGRAGWAEP
jgi:glycosyltransferase involved in cell wall biosynthesis